MSDKTLTMIKENDIRWIDLRFTDTRGKEQHVTIPTSAVDEEFFEIVSEYWGQILNLYKKIEDKKTNYAYRYSGTKTICLSVSRF